MKPRTRIFRYVSYSRIGAYADLGWFWDGVSFENHHRAYSVIMEWLCDCPVIEPPK